MPTPPNHTREAVVARLDERMRTYDLAALLPESALSEDLPAPSNTVGAQFWCLVGARESYARAIEAGAWSAFSCSLTAEGTRQIAAVRAALETSAQAVRQALATTRTDATDALVLDLLEHEAQHQGQLIRYIYALGLEFPASWKARWALD